MVVVGSAVAVTAWEAANGLHEVARSPPKKKDRCLQVHFLPSSTSTLIRFSSRRSSYSLRADLPLVVLGVNGGFTNCFKAIGLPLQSFV